MLKSEKVNICHVHTVCHIYIYTCVYLVRVHLDIFFLVVSDGDDSTKGWKFLFDNWGVLQVHELHEIFVHSDHACLPASSNISLALAQFFLTKKKFPGKNSFYRIDVS